MSEHTPGPWRLELANSGARIMAGKKTQVCAAMAGNRANAHLIAAAPDLLAALQTTLKHIDDDMNGRPVTLWKLRETVCAAIAKAEGRS